MMNSRTTNHKGANECIIFRMKDHTGGEMMFKIKKSVMMSKVFSAYAQRKGLEQASLHFLLNGERISKTDTPKMPSSLYGVKVARARGPTWHPFHQLLSSQLQASMSKIGSQSTK